jgi:predicted phosphodiesterase
MEQLYRLSKQFLHFVLTGCIIFCITEITYAQDQKTNFAVISDHRRDFYGLDKALEFVVSQNVDFLIVVGDFSPLTDTYPYYYAMWGFEVREDVQPNNQNLFFVMGNHDAPPSGDGFFRNNIAPYYPDNGPCSAFCAPQGTIFSFDTENAHFVITNQYWNYPKGGYTSEQLEWIDEDLQASQQPYKFVFGHEPAFPLDRHEGSSLNIDPSMRNEFWEILADNDVLAFFCGHTHHLSVIKNQGVYQIDTGEVVFDHLAIVIVEIDGPLAVARLYETDGSIPTARQNDNVFNASMQNETDGDEVYTVLFDSDFETPGCFIQTIYHFK